MHESFANGDVSFLGGLPDGPSVQLFKPDPEFRAILAERDEQNDALRLLPPWLPIFREGIPPQMARHHRGALSIQVLMTTAASAAIVIRIRAVNVYKFSLNFSEFP
jgi:hypothetical protein